MKYLKLALIGAIASLSIQCTAQKKTSTKSKTVTQQKAVSQKVQKIEVEEMTRGTRRMITYTADTKTSSLNGSESKSETSATEWSNINKQVAALDLAKISSYEAPTQDRFHDGALHATITIYIGDKVYTSQSFDSGRPPKELAALYQTLTPGFKSK